MASDLMRLDPNVLAALPNVVDVLNVQEVARSKWAKGMRVTARNADGTEDISQGDLGKNAIMGEFEGTSAIHAVTPEFCPKPITWGTFKHDNDTHFYLCTFYDFAEDIMPHPESFCADLARTISGVTAGRISSQQELDKHSKSDERAGSKSKVLEALLSALFDKVIPRLLKPLDITPALIHGDLWYGNASVVEGTNDKAIVYDPAAFYGHNEYELGNWRPARNRFTKEFFDAYHSRVPKSNPVDDYDDRLKFYEMRFNLNAAALLPNQPKYLQMVVDAIMELNKTFTGCEMQDSHEIDPGQGK
ncbi:Fructosamine kinase-domain-containing protein [Rhypophila decipiens]|uniref:protein-ribulosamine 3-kinase n=1 Tax=Rhypophila decipiens TaxID=261697 RepID=A0AAN6Y0Z4_9PEZI|nr:Fructosamine kinase-domain-containing protein [Rhypophila decipiens]